MLVDSVLSNSCGGSISTGSGNEVTLIGGTIPSITENQPGYPYYDECEIEASVYTTEAGVYNNILSGDISGYNFDQTNALLSVTDSQLSIHLEAGRYIDQGDRRDVTITVANNSLTEDISNLSIFSDLDSICIAPYCTQSYHYFSLEDAPFTSCSGGDFNSADHSTSFDFFNGEVLAGETCEIHFTLGSAANVYPVSDDFSWVIPVGNIVYDSTSGANIVHSVDVGDYNIRYSRKFNIFDSFDKEKVAVNGISRYEILLRQYSNIIEDNYSNIYLYYILDPGLTVADVHNVANGCGGTLEASPGSDFIRLTGGEMDAYQDCIISVDLKAPNSPGDFLVRFDGGDHLSTQDFSANKLGEVFPFNSFEYLARNSRPLTVLADLGLNVNKEFSPVLINGGAPSRVRIAIENTNPSGSIDLEVLELIDDFSSSNLVLYSDINPKFLDSSGSTVGGCRGAQFSGSPGDTSIIISDAKIDSGETCYFEFNVTSYIGGNHVNTLDIGDVSTKEAVTNTNSASATVTVGYNLNVGKSFIPSSIGESDTSQLRIDIYNTNSLGVDRNGANPSLRDTLPAGMTLVGAPTTNCPSATVISGISGGLSYIELMGGQFNAGTPCQINATVETDSTGIFTNTISAGALITLEGESNLDEARASLSVLAKPIITKSFLKETTNGSFQDRLIFDIQNTNSLTLLPDGFTGISFSDNLVNMELSTPVLFSSTCDSLDYEATPGGNALLVTNAIIPPSSTCRIIFNVESSIIGTHPNQTSGVSSNQTPTPGLPSNIANLIVSEDPSMSKTFTPNSISNGSESRITFSFINDTNVDTGILNEGFVDPLPSSGVERMYVSSTPDIVNDCGLTLYDQTLIDSFGAGDWAINVASGTLPANTTCELSFDVITTGPGTFVNPIISLRTNFGEMSTLAASLTVSSDTTPPVITVNTLLTSDTTPQLTGTVDDTSATISITVSGNTYPATTAIKLRNICSKYMFSLKFLKS